MRFRIVRRQLHRLAQGRQGVLALYLQGRAQHAPAECRFRVLLKQGPCRALHLHIVAGVVQADNLVDFVLLGQQRRRCDRIQGLLFQALRHVVVESARNRGVDNVERLLGLARLQQAAGVRQPELAFIGIDRQGFEQIRQSRLVLAHLSCQQTQIMVGHRVIRLRLQDVEIQLLGLLVAAGLVFSNGKLQVCIQRQFWGGGVAHDQGRKVLSAGIVTAACMNRYFPLGIFYCFSLVPGGVPAAQRSCRNSAVPITNAELILCCCCARNSSPARCGPSPYGQT